MLMGSRYPAVSSALIRSTTGPRTAKTEIPDESAPSARYNLLIKPLAGGIPISASDAMV